MINDASGISAAFDLVISLMAQFVNLLKSIQIFSNTSLFDVLIGFAVVAIVITYLVNVAKRPPRITTSRSREKGSADD